MLLVYDAVDMMSEWTVTFGLLNKIGSSSHCVGSSVLC